MYTLDTGLVFDPFDLSEEVTPDGIMAAIAEHKFSAALAMSFRLNDHNLVSKTVESVPSSDGKNISLIDDNTLGMSHITLLFTYVK